jgi:uncharacterized YigZ family protein
LNTYTTLSREGSASLVEKRSEFIGYAKPVSSEEEAVAFVTSIKKKHADARHNVFAYVLRGGALKRYSDDGEPQGSAGMPVLDVICKSGLDGAVVVVTRYFGGILLGTGGLVRAYSAAASAAIADAGIITYEEVIVFKLRLSYTDHARVQNEFARFGIEAEESEFGADVILTMTSPTDSFDNFKVKMKDLTGGRSIPEEIGRKLAPPRKLL